MTKESDPDRIIQSSYDRIVYKEKLEIDAKFNEFRNIVNQVSKMQVNIKRIPQFQI